MVLDATGKGANGLLTEPSRVRALGDEALPAGGDSDAVDVAVAVGAQPDVQLLDRDQARVGEHNPQVARRVPARLDVIPAPCPWGCGQLPVVGPPWCPNAASGWTPLA